MQSPRLIFLILVFIFAQNVVQALAPDYKKLVKAADLIQLKNLSSKQDSEIQKINFKGNIHALFIDYGLDPGQHQYSELLYKLRT